MQVEYSSLLVNYRPPVNDHSTYGMGLIYAGIILHTDSM
jgi:hypothetical protein